MKSQIAALAIVVVVVFPVAVAQAVTIDLVPVDDPGNAADTTGHGSVPYAYRMGRYDVTNAQYAEFLTAKATTSDPLALWNQYMGSDANGGIVRSGTGPYTYAVKPGQGNQPVVYVTWFDTLRFVNWLNNGQGNNDTEAGSYTLLGGTPTPSNAATIIRSPEAKWVLPTENEWYKAAYYKSGGANAGYWMYPTQSDTAPTWVLCTVTGPNGGTNSANFYDGTNGFALTGRTSYSFTTDYLTNVGAYPLSLSAYGTLDQGGNVWQWNETGDDSSRGLRGGSFLFNGPERLAASWNNGNVPGGMSATFGFRVASLAVAEPASIVLIIAGGLCLLAYAWRRRKGTA